PLLNVFVRFFFQLFAYQLVDIRLAELLKVICLRDIDIQVFIFDERTKTTGAFCNWFAFIMSYRGVCRLLFFDDAYGHLVGNRKRVYVLGYRYKFIAPFYIRSEAARTYHYLLAFIIIQIERQ